MKIVDVVCSPGRTGFFFDDQVAIKTSAVSDGNAYFGYPKTQGFKSIRQSGESISVMFILSDGQIAYGDCAAVQYSGTGGRDPLFLAENFIPIIEEKIKPMYVNKEITNFKTMAEQVDKYIDPVTEKKFHTAIRYGVTQAILDCVAKANKTTMAKIVAKEYNQEISSSLIPIFSQSGDDRYLNADKMILKGAQVLPHGLINNISKLGEKGENLLEYIKWLRERIIKLKAQEDYHPTIHLDVYGTIGNIFDNDYNKIADLFAEYEKAAHPFTLRIEGPIDLGSRQAQIEGLAELRRIVDERGIKVEIVADEWCNTFEDIKLFTEYKAGHMAQIKTPDLGGINNSIEAVIYCKEHGMGAYLGGTCNETERSAQVCANIAMATSPVQYLAKPGMGVDEGYMIVYNEMQRVLALKDIL